MKKKKGKIKKIILTLFFLLLFFMGIAYAALNQTLKFYGKANLVKQQENTGDYLVTYSIENKWFTNGKYYYDITMTLSNHTNNLLDGWQIYMKAPQEANILNYSNVNCKLKKEQIELTNVSYNAQVPAKQSVTFEIQISTIDPYYEPKDIIVNGNSVTPPPTPDEPDDQERNVQILLKEDNNWSSGQYDFYQYAVTIKNVGNTLISSWSFDFLFDKETSIDQIWNAQTSQEENRITIQNSLYNGMIQPEEEISFGFIIKTLEKNIKLTPINIVLK